MPNNYLPFDPMTVPLQGTNLIEASAGTGKTYSIALLVVRLVVQQQVPIEQILMVTFTKAAVAELEERIRRFVRAACHAAEQNEFGDSDIDRIVSGAVAQEGHAAVLRRLRKAVLFLDETSVLTIHGFCQRALSEFAFETGQIFGSEPLLDISGILEDAVNVFWRREITTLPEGALRHIRAHISRSLLLEMVKAHLEGKQILACQGIDPDLLPDMAAWSATADESARLLEEADAAMLACLEANWATFIARCEADKTANKNFRDEMTGPADVFATVKAKIASTKYLARVFEELVPMCADAARIAGEREAHLVTLLTALLARALRDVAGAVRAYKQRHNLLAFDDMISGLNEALMSGARRDELVAALRRKYKAVFIDEFQDTDRQQYEIFDAAFGAGTLLFYIGDPKQSIYGWRKADIFTYFKARADVQHRYTMNRNFRSNRRLIEAMNLFFLPQQGFDTFAFASGAESIDYMPVEAPVDGDKPYLHKDGAPDVPISFSNLPKKEDIQQSLCAQVEELLYSGRYSIAEEGRPRPVRNSDIGILVRGNRDGRQIKELLARRGIAAVTISEDKVLRSGEARSLRYILQAIEHPAPAEISRALLCTELTGIDRTLLLQLSEEKVAGMFRQYNAVWEQDGIYAALMQLMADFGTRERLLKAENGERILTNLTQAIELAHKYQSTRQCTLLELLGWLQRVSEGLEVEGDDYEQRIENDEDAVKIVTIHKSKGLQYPIVMAPTLDFDKDPAHIKTATFREPATGDYIFAHKSQLSEEQRNWLREQTEQENRRLLYVAITRAALKCFVYRHTYYKNSTLAVFQNALVAADATLIELLPAPLLPEARQAPPPETEEGVAHRKAARFDLLDANWRRMSYTALSAAPHAAPKPPATVASGSAYDEFVFRELPRGSHAGNLLHFLFEHIHFTDDSRWDRVIGEAARRFFPLQAAEYAPLLRQLLQEVLRARIVIGGDSFSMSAVPLGRRIHELEFDFPVAAFLPAALAALGNGEMELYTRDLPRIQGMMNGKVDLFFEHGGKYYVLDWKSNYLGDRLADYHPDGLGAVMSAHNYHLQYLLYTAAACRYLAQRLGSFDYETQFGGVIYLFVRGVRAGQEHGVFTARPSRGQLAALEELFRGAPAGDGISLLQ
ncbi:MAG: hypothetical protein EOO11_05020 [Chitinophagaceae bacterium]|nr:MAG: hypothetical protein EOO11_05020 [Chitinophagaceae bacterium]